MSQVHAHGCDLLVPGEIADVTAVRPPCCAHAMSADHGAVDNGPHPVRKTMATTEQRATESPSRTSRTWPCP